MQANWGRLGTYVVVGLLTACTRIESVSVEPETVVLTSVGQSDKLRAQAKDQNGKPVADAKIEFRSGDDKVATVDAGGQVVAVKSGTTTITAAAGDKSGSAKVDVMIPAKIEFPAPKAEGQAGGDELGGFALQGIGTESPLAVRVLDETNRVIPNAQVTIVTENGNIAQIEKKESGSTVRANAPGETKVVATYGQLKRELPVSVTLPPFDTLKFEPAEGVGVAGKPVTVVVGATAKFVAQVTGASGSPVPGVPITFRSDKADVATVDGAGTVTGVKPGQATISADAGGKTASVKVIVK